MRNKTILVAACMSLLPCTGLAQIYSNGGLSSGAVTQSGAVAPAGTEWSELQQQPFEGEDVANTLAGTAGSVTGSAVYRVADDFIVPAGQEWILQVVALYAYQTGAAADASPIDAYTLRIWDGVPDAVDSTLVCGDEFTDQLLSSTNSGLLRIFNSVVGTISGPPTAPSANRVVWRSIVAIPPDCAGVALPAGEYWLDWNSQIGATTNHFVPPIVVPGARTRPGANALQRTPSGWVEVLDVGSAPSGVDTGPPLAQDLPFELFGSVVLPPEVFANGFEALAAKN